MQSNNCSHHAADHFMKQTHNSLLFLKAIKTHGIRMHDEERILRVFGQAAALQRQHIDLSSNNLLIVLCTCTRHGCC